MKFTEDQRYAIIEAVYNHVGDEYDKDEHGNAALKLDSQDIKLLSRLESILSPLPHQDSASAEEILESIRARERYPMTIGINLTLEAMHQFAKSELAKVVAEKEKEITGQSEVISTMYSQIVDATRQIEHLEQGMANWVRVSNERQEELNEAERRVKELSEYINSVKSNPVTK